MSIVEKGKEGLVSLKIERLRTPQRGDHLCVCFKRESEAVCAKLTIIVAGKQRSLTVNDKKPDGTIRHVFDFAGRNKVSYNVKVFDGVDETPIDTIKGKASYRVGSLIGQPKVIGKKKITKAAPKSEKVLPSPFD